MLLGPQHASAVRSSHLVASQRRAVRARNFWISAQALQSAPIVQCVVSFLEHVLKLHLGHLHQSVKVWNRAFRQAFGWGTAKKFINHALRVLEVALTRDETKDMCAEQMRRHNAETMLTEMKNRRTYLRLPVGDEARFDALLLMLSGQQVPSVSDGDRERDVAHLYKTPGPGPRNFDDLNYEVSDDDGDAENADASGLESDLNAEPVVSGPDAHDSRRDERLDDELDDDVQEVIKYGADECEEEEKAEELDRR